MPLVIVTRNQYILANAIHHITLDELHDYHEISIRGRSKHLREKVYRITVLYIPETSAQNNRGDRSECCITLRGRADAYRIYKDLIRQIREQMPDALFLDKAFENLLGEEELKEIANTEIDELSMEALVDEPSKKKVRRARKKKRRSKKVLRGSRKRR